MREALRMSSDGIAPEVSVTTVEALNAASPQAFVAAVGFVFEDSPWIARAAYERRPFASRAALHAALVAVVADAGEERQVALIAAHPDLAGRVAREGRLTAASRDEQAAAGLDRLGADELAHFEEVNARYRARFSFPFVICAREQTQATILRALEERSANSRATEIATALAEIAKIARLRLATVLPE
jgi:2-oxo-4-hydroxy-4-carboxy-5-ureidoimidazoline decarboxylase